MDNLYTTAGDLIRQIPGVLLETGDKRIDYLASAALAELTRDLRHGQITEGDQIAGRLQELQEALVNWMAKPRSPRVAQTAQQVIDLCGQFNAEFQDSKSAPV